MPSTKSSVVASFTAGESNLYHWIVAPLGFKSLTRFWSILQKSWTAAVVVGADGEAFTVSEKSLLHPLAVYEMVYVPGVL